MKKLVFILPTLILAACDNHGLVQRQMKNCQIVSVLGPMGDYNVCCPKSLSMEWTLYYSNKEYPFVSFLSTTEPLKPFTDFPKECHYFINVIPSQSGDCYRIHDWELSVDDDKHAIEICPSKEL